jgi:hypothetical protein
MESQYLSADGLMRIDPQDKRGPVSPEFPETVKNDNGILFRAVFEIHTFIPMWDPAIRKNIDETIKRLEVRQGLFSRRPGDRRLEAHDNYIGICALSYFFNLRYAFDVLVYGMRNGYCYNNVEPSKYDVKAQRQGSEIAFYHLCAKHIPDIANSIWLALGIIVGCFKRDMGSIQLASLKVAVIKSELKHQPVIQGLVLGLAVKYYEYTLKKIGGLGYVFKRYYRDENHPIRRIYNF